jgi:hypothetical protein
MATITQISQQGPVIQIHGDALPQQGLSPVIQIHGGALPQQGLSPVIQIHGS